MSVEKPSQSTSRPCTVCSTFFGYQASDWLCSSCYKMKLNDVKRKDSVFTNASEKQEVLLEEPNLPKTQPAQVDKSRCFKCTKRVGLLGVECKCSMVFCNQHRMPQVHECSIDYRKLGKEKLAKQHVLVAPPKITEI